MLAHPMPWAVPPQQFSMKLNSINQGGNYWTLFTLGIRKVLHAVFHYVSITHLGFDALLPLGRAIAAYPKHRVKRLRRQPS